MGEVTSSTNGATVGLAFEGPACEGMGEAVRRDGSASPVPGPLVLLWALDVLCALDHLHSACRGHRVAHGNMAVGSVVVVPGVARPVAKLFWQQLREVDYEDLFFQVRLREAVRDVAGWAGCFLSLADDVQGGFPAPVVQMLRCVGALNSAFGTPVQRH